MGTDARLRPAEYVELLEVRGLRVLHHRAGYRAQCPCHDDHEPSLFIDERDDHLLLHCFGCEAKFTDLLAAVGIETTPSTSLQKNVYTCSTANAQYVRIEGGAELSRFTRVGLDLEGWRGDLNMRMPARAGKVMEAVAKDLVMLANE
jgi:hypothetical protein